MHSVFNNSIFTAALILFAISNAQYAGCNCVALIEESIFNSWDGSQVTDNRQLIGKFLFQLGSFY